MRSGLCSAVDFTGVTFRRATVGMRPTLPARDGSTRSEYVEVHGLGLRRRARAELLLDHASAPLVHAKGLGRVARPRVGPHEEAIGGLAERLELQDELGVAAGQGEQLLLQAYRRSAFQRADPDVAEHGPAPRGPRALFAG